MGLSNGNFKILISGVGGQGIVYLTNILSEAARLSGIPVHVSEIHGLSQRGGTVTAGIGLGEYCTGFTGTANVDLLIGLEPLEAQRCLPHLHQNSGVIFSDYKIPPYAVNAQLSDYPDTASLAGFLQQQCAEVIYVKALPESLEPVLINVYLLGKALHMKCFPLGENETRQAILNTVAPHHKGKTLNAFELGFNS